MSKDYRINQFRRDWWGERVPLAGNLTRNDLMWFAVGFVFAVICLMFPINWDWVFGAR